jgi:uncharacterized membrane protein YbaN (DUF454 family)
VIRQTKVLFWRISTVVALAFGIIGIALPVVPTVPFLILAAWTSSKGWPAIEVWLLNHPVHGPPIRRWREHGVVPRRVKWVATLMMATSAVGIQFFALPEWVRITTPLIMGAVAVWLWLRPEDVGTSKEESGF